MASPNKIKNVGYDYKPFQMKASGARYNNSPIEKNYGTPAQRGIEDMPAFGTKSSEMDGIPYAGGVGSSPAKGWLSNVRDKIMGRAKKAKEKVQGIGKGILGINDQGAEGGADHTHPEFAQLDEATQGATEDGGVGSSIAGMKQKTGAGMWGGIGDAARAGAGMMGGGMGGFGSIASMVKNKRIGVPGAFGAQEEELV